MKPISKCLAATTLAAIALFGSVQLINNQPSTVQAKQPITEKKDLISRSSAQLRAGAPLVAQVKANKINEHSMHAIAPAHKQIVFNKKINVAKLSKNIPAASAGIELKANPAADSIVSYTEAVAKMAEIVAVQTSQPAEKENNLQQEITAIADVVAEPQRTGGNSYQGGKVAKASKKSSKNGTNGKGAIDIAAFASIKQADNGADSYSYMSLYDETEALKDFAARSGSNTDYAIMVNLGLKSGKKRFFVIDLSSNTIVKSGLVAEGSGDVNTSFDKKYSNDMGSMSTSLGVFKIGKKAKKDAYRLHGLQESNSNAFKRAMMLQAADDVPSDEINFPMLKTNGSLSLSTNFFKEISPMLEESVKPVLLWVYDAAAESQASYSVVDKKN